MSIFSRKNNAAPAEPVPRRPRARMSLGRQGRHYLFIGGIQWLVDWGVMVALSHFGMGIGPANVAGRISGALLGYWANGKLTFAGDDTAIGRTQLLRFLAMLLVTPAISTWSMPHIDEIFGRGWAGLAKPGLSSDQRRVGQACVRTCRSRRST